MDHLYYNTALGKILSVQSEEKCRLSMGSDQNIIKFTRQTLGCKCPDEVFDRIECRDGDSGTDPYTRSITIGGRLLVYIWETNDPSLVEAGLPAMLLCGKNERDRRGLNRFRAVIAADDVDGINSIAQRLFRKFSDKDEKVHLHVVSTEDVANLIV